MRDDLVKEIGEDNFNANSASKNIQSQIDKLNKMIPAYMEEIASFHKTLDSEQKQKLGELATKFKEKREQHRKGRKHDKDDKHDKVIQVGEVASRRGWLAEMFIKGSKSRDRFCCCKL